MGKIIFIVNLLFATILALTPLAGHVNPSTIPWLGLLPLAFPLFLIVNVLFLGFWAYRKSWRILASIVSIAFCFPTLQNHLAIGKRTIDNGTDPISVKMLSFNVRVFDLYNWTNNHQTRDSIVALLKGENAGITCLQEYYRRADSKFPTLKLFKHEPFAKYKHIELTNSVNYFDKVNQEFGLATFSQYPIINKGRLSFKDSTLNLCMFSDIAIGVDTIRVYNCHLASLKFDRADYEFLENIMGNGSDDNIAGSKRILARLSHGYRKRGKQTDMIRQHMSQSPYPVVICGDFNDTPGSYTYVSLSEQLSDAFIEKGLGWGSTYAGKIPGLRIDYILHDPALRCTEFQRLDPILSDHYPITATLELNKP